MILHKEIRHRTLSFERRRIKLNKFFISIKNIIPFQVEKNNKLNILEGALFYILFLEELVRIMYNEILAYMQEYIEFVIHSSFIDEMKINTKHDS